MKNVRWMTGVAGIGLFLLASRALAQGNLTPPGPPGPMMKTLEQVEPRTAITNLPYLINSSGSYYLTQNLTGTAGNNGIVITTTGVTLDLNGFQLQGVAGSQDGIFVLGSRSGIVIRNGQVRDWDGSGVNAGNAFNSRLDNLFANGCGSNGLVAGDRCVVQSCIAFDNGAQGIRVGANGQVRECIAAQNSGGGIWTDDGCIIEGCTSATNDEGVVAGTAIIIQNCTVRDNAVDGIRVSYRCRVENNVSEDNGQNGDGAGIHATGNGNRITGNHVLGTDRGLDLDGSFNYIADNTVLGNGDNYDIADGNQLNLLLGEIPETLDWPCSVKLAGSLTCAATGTNGIVVRANDVTIDMAGHTLAGPGTDSGNGIYQAAQFRNLRVFNGKIVDWRGGGKAGVEASGQAANIENVQASTNYQGIQVGDGAILDRCTVQHNKNSGISTGSGCALSDCTAEDNQGDGIVGYQTCTMIGCAARLNASGISAGYGSTLRDCTVSDNGQSGIDTGGGCLLSGCAAVNNGWYGIYSSYEISVIGCTVQANSGDGIRTSTGVILNNHCKNNGSQDGDGAGIHLTGVIDTGGRIEGNTVSGNDRGIDVDKGGNFIARNTVSGNTLNWDVAASNLCLVVQGVPAGAISGDSGGISPGSTDPNANFSY